MLWGILRKIAAVDNEIARKKFLINSFSVVALTTLAFFTIRGILKGEWEYSIILSGFFLMTLVNLVLLHLKGTVKLSAAWVVILMFVLNLLLFTFLGEGKSGILWYFIFPPLAILLLDIKKGVTISLVLILVTLGLLVVKPAWLQHHYERYFLLRFLLVYLISIVFLVMFDFARLEAQAAYLNKIRELKFKNDELIALEEELRQNVEELQATNEQLEHSRRVIEKKNLELRLYYTAIEQTIVPVIFSNTEGVIYYVNRAFSELTGYSRQEAKGRNFKFLASQFVSEELIADFFATVSQGGSWDGEAVLKKKDGRLFIARIVVTPIADEKGKIFSYVVMMYDMTREKVLGLMLKRKHLELRSVYKDLTDSLQFAKVIMGHLFSYDMRVLNYFSGYFILSMPKGPFSGDFYYFEKVDSCIVIGLADCTGHGIPAAFISILGYSLLKDTLHHRILEPDRVLEILRDEFSGIFKDYLIGMDMGLCVIDTQTNVLKFSGANSKFVLIRRGQLIEYKSVKSPVGRYLKKRKFRQYSTGLEKGDKFYLFSDGYYDQLGRNEEGKLVRYYYSNFKKLLLQISTLDMPEQKQVLLREFNKWKGNVDQTDDVTVLGFCV